MDKIIEHYDAWIESRSEEEHSEYDIDFSTASDHDLLEALRSLANHLDDDLVRLNIVLPDTQKAHNAVDTLRDEWCEDHDRVVTEEFDHFFACIFKS